MDSKDFNILKELIDNGRETNLEISRIAALFEIS